jgi:hypothetical protein
MARISRITSRKKGAFSQRDMVVCEHRSRPLSAGGRRPDRNRGPEISRPPSRAAITFLRLIARNQNGAVVSSSMAGAVQSEGVAGWQIRKRPQPLTPYRDAFVTKAN